MRPDDDRIDEVLSVYLQSQTPAQRRKAAEELRVEIDGGRADLADFRIHVDSCGEIDGVLRMLEHPEGSWVLTGIRVAAGVPPSDAMARNLVADAMQRVRVRGGRRATTLVPVASLTDGYRRALAGEGFTLRGERFEFRRPVAELPGEEGTSLEWKDLDLVGIDIAAAILKEVTVGDPASDDEDENPVEAIENWLADPDLTSGPECVQVGFLDGRPVAFCAAQIIRGDGWSRITYMGVSPAARGRGLGRWVHRHGFAMIRAQGGTLYHGGTSSTNEPMLRLFRAHGCSEWAHLSEWKWERSE